VNSKQKTDSIDSICAELLRQSIDAKLSRRHFLTLGVLMSVTAFSPSFALAQPSSTPTPSPLSQGLINDLFTKISADALAADFNHAAQMFSLLGHAYDISSEYMDPANPNPLALDRINKMAADSNATNNTDWLSFQALRRLLIQFTPDPHSVGLAVQTGAVLASAYETGGVSLLDPKAVVALNLAGVWAEDTFKKGERLLGLIPLEQAQYISSSVIQSSLGAAGVNKTFAEAVQLPALTSRLGVSFDLSTNLLISALPADLQASASQALAQNQGGQGSDVQASIKTAIQDQLTDLSDLVHGQQIALQNIQEDEVRREAQEHAKADLEKASLETAGEIQVGSFLLNHIVGASEAQTFMKGATALSLATKAVGLFVASSIGPWALAGSLANSADILIGLFQGAKPDPVVAALNRIDASLDQIKAELQWIEQRQIEIIEKLSLIYKQLLTNQQETRVQLDNIEKLLGRAITVPIKLQRNQSEATFKGDINKCKSQLSQTSHHGQWPSRFALQITAICNFATATATAAYYTGDMNDDFTDTIDDMSYQRTSQYFFAIIPVACHFLHVPFADEQTTSAGEVIANPVIWARGSLAYLQLLTMAGDIVIEGSPDQLKQLWATGLQIRKAALSVSGVDFCQAAAAKYVEASGFSESQEPAPGKLAAMVFEELNKFEDSELHVKRWDLGSPLPRVFTPFDAWYVEGTSVYIATVKIYRVSHDFFDVAVQKGLIVLEKIRSLGAGAGYSDRDVYRVRFNVSPKKGQELFENKELLINKRDGFEGRCWNIHGTDSCESPAELLNACADLVHTYYDAVQIRTQFPSRLEERININAQSQAFKELKTYGTLAKFGASVAAWRRAPASIPNDVASDFGNVPGIVTTDELKAFLTKVIDTSPGATPEDRWFSWADYILSKLRESVLAASKGWTGIGKGIGRAQGIPIVDETLRQLAGFMRVRGVDFKWPTE
jgi:hypothetical protein